MRSVLIPVLSTLVGCSSSAALELLQAIADGDTTRTRALTATDATLVTAADTITGGGDTSVLHDPVEQVPVTRLMESAAARQGRTGHGVAEVGEVRGEGLAAHRVDGRIHVASARRERVEQRLARGFVRFVPRRDVVAERAGHPVRCVALEQREGVHGVGSDREEHRIRQRELRDVMVPARPASGRQGRESGVHTRPTGTDIVQLDDDGRVVLVAGFF